MPDLEHLKVVKTPIQVNIAVKIGSADLPLSCPLPNMSVWNMHPKVYLDLDEDQQAKCPYCGTVYLFNEE